jgi:hypothetical protein
LIAFIVAFLLSNIFFQFYCLPAYCCVLSSSALAAAPADAAAVPAGGCVLGCASRPRWRLCAGSRMDMKRRCHLPWQQQPRLQRSALPAAARADVAVGFPVRPHVPSPSPSSSSGFKDIHRVCPALLLLLLLPILLEGCKEAVDLAGAGAAAAALASSI